MKSFIQDGNDGDDIGCNTMFANSDNDSDDQHDNKLPDVDQQPDQPTEGFRSTKQTINQSIMIINHRISGIGFQLWPAARVMSTFIDERTCTQQSLSLTHPQPTASHPFGIQPIECFTDWSRIRACELGAGCGLVSMFVASLGCSVTVTDLPMVLPHIRENVLVNPSLFIHDTNASDDMSFVCPSSGGRIHIAPLSWGDSESIKQSSTSLTFDFLLLSDCVYWEDLFEPLLITLRALTSLNPACKIWIAQSPRRPKVESRFFKAARKHFDCQLIDAMKYDPNDRQMVSVYQFTLKPPVIKNVK